MNEDATGQWITVSEAAAALKVSERTIQRRCKSGSIVARLVSGEDGQQWQIAASEVPPLVPTGAANTADKVPPLIKHETNTADTQAVIGAAIGADTDLMARLIDEKDERIADLRATVESQRLQIEAANRTNAEVSAALRSLVAAQSKALPEPNADATPMPPQSPETATERAASVRTPDNPPAPIADTKKATPKKTFRKWLLGVLRDGK